MSELAHGHEPDHKTLTTAAQMSHSVLILRRTSQENSIIGGALSPRVLNPFSILHLHTSVPTRIKRPFRVAGLEEGENVEGQTDRRQDPLDMDHRNSRRSLSLSLSLSLHTSLSMFCIVCFDFLSPNELALIAVLLTSVSRTRLRDMEKLMEQQQQQQEQASLSDSNMVENSLPSDEIIREEKS